MRELVVGDIHFGTKSNSLEWLYKQCKLIDTQITDIVNTKNIQRINFIDIFEEINQVDDILKKDHTLFSEAFFHGEEDFELGLRMKRMRVKMGCYTPSVIYHKVGRSSGSVGEKIGLTYCYYLNRFINLRHNLNFLSFYCFLCVYFPYVVRLLHNNGLSYTKAFRFYCKVVTESHKLDGVTYEKFMECVKKTSI